MEAGGCEGGDGEEEGRGVVWWRDEGEGGEGWRGGEVWPVEWRKEREGWGEWDEGGVLVVREGEDGRREWRYSSGGWRGRKGKLGFVGSGLWDYYFFIRRRKRSSGEITARAASPLERSFGALER